MLTPQETVEIFAVLRRLAAEGTSIVFISHKLYEVLDIADRITVIRRGKVVGQADPKTATEEHLAEMMVGREVSLVVDKGPAKPGDVVLRVENLTVADDRGSTVVDHCSFEVRAGEIFGIAGVAGNGQAELVEALNGLRRATGGTVRLVNDDVTNHSSRDLSERGIAYIPGDRQRYGLVLPYPIEDNLVLTEYYHPPFSRFGVIDEKAISKRASELIPQFDIRTPSGDCCHVHPVRRQPAEGHRRPRVQPGPRPAHRGPADARHRRRLDRVHPQADRLEARRRAPPSCSCRPSWTRSSSCRTGSGSSTAGSWWRSSTPRRRRRTRSA